MIKKINNIIIYYIDNQESDIKDFCSNFDLERNYTIKTNTSIKDFYSTLKSDIKNNNYLKIIIINSYIKSKSLNTNTAIEIIPLIRHLDKKTKIILFSKENNFTLNMTENYLNASDFILKTDTFFFVLKAIINKYITEIEIERINLYFRLSFSFFILIILISVILIFII